LPFAVKREAFFHLTNNMAYLLMVLLSVLMPLSMVVRFQHGLYGTLFLDLPFFLTATASVAVFYVATQREQGVQGWWGRLKYLPFLMSLGIGMAINNAKAVLEALLNQQSGFARTPKTGSEGKKVAVVKKSYRGSKSWMSVVELCFAAYFTGALWFAWDKHIYTSVPFIVLFLVGFLYVGVSSLMQGLQGLFKANEAPAPVKAVEEQARRAA
jgi:hypothetical protein